MKIGKILSCWSYVLFNSNYSKILGVFWQWQRWSDWTVGTVSCCFITKQFAC